MREHLRQLLKLGCVSTGTAVGLGLLLGWGSRAGGWGFSFLAVFIGLAVGGVAVWMKARHSRSCAAVAVIASTVGLIAFAIVSYAPSWKAQNCVPNAKLDELCVRVVALQLCHKRKIMGVFDYRDVPAAIRNEANQNVKNMPQPEKLAICDQTFGKRINDSSTGTTKIGAILVGGLWVALALAASAAPTLIKQRLD